MLGVDAHLPAVARASLLPAALLQRFVDPPIWAPEVLRDPRVVDRPVMSAAVLVPIVMHERPTVLLTERTKHLSTHSGQIAFPGGKSDDGDVDAAATALREAWEEVGLPPEAVRVLGHLPIYTTGTAFNITPVVALVRPGFDLMPNANEVADVFEVPLDFLMNPANHQRHALEWEGAHREWYAMNYADRATTPATERFIWGATAGMLRNFYRFLVAGQMADVGSSQ
jgi:8-oxo-dGTP pyrophosphatase MutT (NUDIX family)